MQVANPTVLRAARAAVAAADLAADGSPGPSPEPAISQNIYLDEVEVRAWRAFLVAHAQVARKLETDLLTISHMPLA